LLGRFLHAKVDTVSTKLDGQGYLQTQASLFLLISEEMIGMQREMVKYDNGVSVWYCTNG